jgi:hypothetical protein
MYPGSTKKSLLAQDEWLELNSKEFLNFPSVRTLEGMSHQGNIIGMTLCCKQFLETVYLAGTITERVVYRSGNGAKGDGQKESKYIWEVVELFLGDCFPLFTGTCCQIRFSPYMLTSKIQSEIL